MPVRVPLVSREDYIQRSLEKAFPGGQWIEESEGVQGNDGTSSAIAPPAPAPSVPIPRSFVVQPLGPHRCPTLPDGTPVVADDPKLKHAVQRTGKAAVLFARKSDAAKFAAAIVASAKESGATVGGSASRARWSVYPPNGDPWGMGIFSRPKRG